MHMARIRIEESPKLASWDEVNLSLAEIGEHKRDIEAIEAEMQKAIDDAKLAAEMQARPHQEAIKRLEAGMIGYVDDHRDEMDGKKTKDLNFGQVGYRKSTKVMLPKGAAKIAEIIAKLKARRMTDCIITKPETIDKDALKKYPANDIVDCGVGLDVQDTFWYQVDKEKLKPKV